MALREATKLALGVPRYAANYIVKARGFFKSLNDSIVIHVMGQQERLETSPQGRKILENLGYNTTNFISIPSKIPPWGQLSRMKVNPIPNTMHKIKSMNRRLDRVKRPEKEA